jgi:phosphoglycolate phosphatase-like HAD superfamily hydrolase
MAQRKSIEEQIKSKQAAIAAKQEKVTALQEDISKLKKEVETLQSFEVKAMLKEIDMPFDQVKELLKSLKAAPQGETENKA